MFWLSPLLTVFYPPFWKELKFHSTGYGAFYLLYLTAILTLAGSIFLFAVAPKYVYPELPLLWKVLPEHANWTEQGLNVNSNKPFTLQYKGEAFGMIDTSLSFVRPSDLSRYSIYATRTDLYVKDQDDGSYKATSLLPDKAGKEPGDMVSFEASIIDSGEPLPTVHIETLTAAKGEAKIYEYGPADIARWVDILWKAAIVFVMTFGSVIFYVWMFCVALFYSLAGLIFNSAFVLNATYGRILNAAIFATTPAIYLKIAGVLVPKAPWLGSLWLCALATLAYVAIILRSWRSLGLAEGQHQEDNDVNDRHEH